MSKPSNQRSGSGDTTKPGKVQDHYRPESPMAQKKPPHQDTSADVIRARDDDDDQGNDDTQDRGRQQKS
jgi:hypothetical protein